MTCPLKLQFTRLAPGGAFNSLPYRTGTWFSERLRSVASHTPSRTVQEKNVEEGHGS